MILNFKFKYSFFRAHTSFFQELFFTTPIKSNKIISPKSSKIGQLSSRTNYHPSIQERNLEELEKKKRRKKERERSRNEKFAQPIPMVHCPTTSKLEFSRLRSRVVCPLSIPDFILFQNYRSQGAMALRR